LLVLFDFLLHQRHTTLICTLIWEMALGGAYRTMANNRPHRTAHGSARHPCDAVKFVIEQRQRQSASAILRLYDTL
jgi:hypothetical protein